MDKLDHLRVLENAISDAGHWRWWDEELPDSFQVEFGMVQLLGERAKPGAPPSSVFALRFRRPSTVAFVTHIEAPAELDIDWPRLLRADQLEPFSVEYDAFSFSDRAIFERMLAGARHIETLHGEPPTLEALAEASCKLAFWAGSIGCIVTADEMVAVSHDGVLTPDDVIEHNRRWWDYWRDYWKRKCTDDALPYDGTCEVCIPLRGGDS